MGNIVGLDGKPLSDEPAPKPVDPIDEAVGTVALQNDPKRKDIPAYTVIPMQVLARRDLTIGAKIAVGCLVYVEARGDIKGDLVAVVATLSGMSTSKAKGCLVELEAHGLLKRGRRG